MSKIPPVVAPTKPITARIKMTTLTGEARPLGLGGSTTVTVTDEEAIPCAVPLSILTV